MFASLATLVHCHALLCAVDAAAPIYLVHVSTMLQHPLTSLGQCMMCLQDAKLKRAVSRLNAMEEECKSPLAGQHLALTHCPTSKLGAGRTSGTVAMLNATGRFSVEGRLSEDKVHAPTAAPTHAGVVRGGGVAGARAFGKQETINSTENCIDAAQLAKFLNPSNAPGLSSVDGASRALLTTDGVGAGFLGTGPSGGAGAMLSSGAAVGPGPASGASGKRLGMKHESGIPDFLHQPGIKLWWVDAGGALAHASDLNSCIIVAIMCDHKN